MSGQLHAPAVLPPSKDFLIPIQQEVLACPVSSLDVVTEKNIPVVQTASSSAHVLRLPISVDALSRIIQTKDVSEHELKSCITFGMQRIPEAFFATLHSSSARCSFSHIITYYKIHKILRSVMKMVQIQSTDLTKMCISRRVSIIFCKEPFLL